MEPDFSGYATKAGLRCSDGRTIMPDAFKHQDKARVPLVWQHGHTDPENVLGHAILENRDDGVYAYGYFNDSGKAKHARGLLEHGDVNMLSIWANNLIERSGRVLHGAIREVSLVLAGANPGAVIENVTISHGIDGEDSVLEDEAVIYTGLEIELAHSEDTTEGETTTEETETETEVEAPAEGEGADESEEGLEHADAGGDLTVQDVYDTLNEQQKEVVHFMIGEALASAGNNNSNTDNQSAQHSDSEKDDIEMTNVFEQTEDGKAGSTQLSHDDMKTIVASAARSGSLKDAVQEYALAHGIENIDQMFPDEVSVPGGTPEFLARRTEWVSNFLGGARKSPFSRIRTFHADITMDEARAKGYVTGTLKKEEFFSVAKRSTTPTTIYKKQKLDRDDMVDITDFDVVAWLKAEMRLMLDEEVARAALVGDGRDISHEDKISETCIRPIASDHELYTTIINVDLNDSNSSIAEFVDAVVGNRHYYKGSGLPNMYCSETLLAKFLLLKDSLGRRIYPSIADVAAELRVSSIIPVEVMEEYPTILAIFVNPADYVFGATAGGQVSLFDDFDIDYNQYKYLIETRLCGALTKLKSAIVVKQVGAGEALVTPAAPTFNELTGALTINDTAHVVYKKADGTTVTNSGSPYTVAAGESLTINATPATGYYFATSEEDSWTFEHTS